MLETPINREKIAREKQLRMGVEWKKRGITTEKLRSRGIELDIADVKEYERRRQEHGVKKTEEPWWAEWMFLEGSDSSGVTKPEGKGYRWFGDSVVAFSTHHIDDTLRGADSILMFIDPEDERRATPITVDITIDPNEYNKKFQKDFERLISRYPFEPSVYWMDTTTEDAQGYLDSPEEGKIKSLNTSVYIPKELIAKFRDESVSLSDADLIMKRLGAFVIRQMATELETEALMLTDKIRFSDIQSSVVEFPEHLSREDLMTLLEDGVATGSGNNVEKMKVLIDVLPNIWEAQDGLGEMHPSMEKYLPKLIQDIVQASRRKKAA